MLSPSSRDVTRELLTPLRAAHVQATPSLMTTVLLFVNHAATVADLGDDFVRTVMEFEKVFLVFGDHSNVADLKRVRINHARTCLILAEHDAQVEGMGSDDPWGIRGTSGLDTTSITKFLACEQSLAQTSSATSRHEQHGAGSLTYVVETSSLPTIRVPNRNQGFYSINSPCSDQFSAKYKPFPRKPYKKTEHLVPRNAK